MYSLGGSLIGELDYHGTFELYYFFFLEKVFFKGLQLQFTPSPFLFAKLSKRKIKKWKID